MQIQAIELKGYKRFPLLGKDIVRFDFNSKLTLITGVNGSGKSSLISELIPCVTPKEFFDQGGYKRLYITHNNNSYIIEQLHNKEVEYNFIVNGENMNLSKNVTLQRELIEKHFALSPIVSDILVGAESFTNLTSVQRKKLFNSITNMNIDSVIDYYNTLKEEHKLKQHYTKTQQKTIEHEKLKQSDETSYLKTLQDKENTNVYIDILLELKSSLQPFKQELDIHSVANNLVSTMDKLSKVYSKYYTHILSYPYKDLKSIDKKYNTIKANVLASIDSLYNKLQELDSSKREIDSLSNVGLSDLELESSQLNSTLQKTLETITYINNINDCNLQAVEYAVDVLVQTIPYIRAIPVDPTKRYTKASYEELLSTRDRKHTQLLTSKSAEESLLKELNAPVDDNSVTCPNCHSTFIPTVDKSHIKKHLTTTLEEIQSLTIELQQINTKIKSAQEYLETYTHIQKVYIATKETLQYFWSIVNTNNLLTTDTEKVISMIKELSIQTKYIQIAKDLQERILTIQSQILILQKNKDKSIGDINSQIEQVKYKLDTLYTEKENINYQIGQLETVNKVYTAYSVIEKSIEAILQSLRSSNVSNVVSNVISLIDTELRSSKLKLVELDEKIVSYKSSKETIDKLQLDLDENMNHVNVLDFLLQELSPKDGLIAKSVSNFLNVIVSSINSIISSIWNYNMLLVPIDVDKDDLNYKFKLLVNDTPNADDISKASSGMKEIIDLSFRLTLYKLLNLQGYPVYLDEFGVRLDVGHRSKIADMIFKLMNSSTYSQVFLITHMDFQYAQYKDVEIIEL
jgi:DNA repair exonuclease SbcCD ATPase subunit